MAKESIKISHSLLDSYKYNNKAKYKDLVVQSSCVFDI